jgi:hypothetical protein
MLESYVRGRGIDCPLASKVWVEIHGYSGIFSIFLLTNIMENTEEYGCVAPSAKTHRRMRYRLHLARVQNMVDSTKAQMEVEMTCPPCLHETAQRALWPSATVSVVF